MTVWQSSSAKTIWLVWAHDEGRSFHSAKLTWNLKRCPLKIVVRKSIHSGSMFALTECSMSAIPALSVGWRRSLVLFNPFPQSRQPQIPFSSARRTAPFGWEPRTGLPALSERATQTAEPLTLTSWTWEAQADLDARSDVFHLDFKPQALHMDAQSGIHTCSNLRGHKPI